MKYTFYSNYYSEEMEKYAVENLLENGIYENAEDIPEADIFEEIAFINDFEWEDIKSEMKNFFEGEILLVCGNVGRWDGVCAAGKVIEYDELYKCWNDCDYIELYEENGHFFIKCSHHDGTNFFEVKLMTDRGIEYFRKWEDSWDNRKSEQEIHTTLWNNSHYTHIPHFARNVYGCKIR